MNTGPGTPTTPPPIGPPPAPGLPPAPGYGYGYGYGAPPPSTNGLAITSLVLACAQPFIWFFGAIGAVITGHIALHQLKHENRNQSGRGIAIAGLVLGYIGLALTVLFFVLIIGLFAAAPHIVTTVQSEFNRTDATMFVRKVESIAVDTHRNPRDVSVIREAAAANATLSTKSYRLPDGTPIGEAGAADFARATWHVEMTGAGNLSSSVMCVTIPLHTYDTPVVVEGPCVG